MSFKIHPGLGLGRAGDSPTDWFIAPETSDLPLVPPGGYRDAELRLKRQGARFRVFEYTGVGDPVECTSPSFQIEWHVTLRKDGVAAPETIVDTPNQTKDVPVIPFTSPSQVSLGQLRTDGAGRLIVLSGVVDGTDFDARCEGRVTARVRRDGELVFEGAVASWVLLTAPDFLPQVRGVTAYDQLMDAWQTHVGFSPAELAAAPSLRADIYPMLRSGVPFTTEPTPPAIAPVTPSTPYSTRLLQHWANDNVVHDLPSMLGEPPPLPLTPKELDRGPLSHAAGSGFWDVRFPGDFSQYTPLLLFSEPLRFDPALPETTLQGKLLPSVNWLSDYGACSGEWPTQVPSPLSGDPFEGDWRAQGFIVLQGDELVYQESAVEPYILQLTHSIDFGVVNPAIGGPGRQAAAIEMEVGNLGPASLSFDLVLPLPAQVVAVTASVSASGVPVGESRTLRLWIAYETGADIAPGAVVQFTDSNGGSYSIPVVGQTGTPTTTAIALVLDLSTSMTEDRGDGLSKLTGLKQAVEVLLSLTDDLSGVGVAPFSTDALPAQSVLKLGEVQPSSLTGRETIHNFVDALSVVGATSIGDGLVSGRAVLGGASGYDRQVLIVVTDGLENQPVWIRDVASTIDDRTYAVGIGGGSNVNVGTLQTLTGNTGGYLLLTGNTTAGDNALLLEKHFVQILSGVQHEQLLVDPVKLARPGVVEKIPFAVTEGDSSFTALVVSDRASELQLALQTPEGDVLSPAGVEALPQGRFIDGRRVRAFKVQLPLRTSATTSHFAGQWWLLVSVGQVGADGAPRATVAAPSRKPGIAFRAAVSCYSALELDASIQQTGVILGSELLLDASLRWYGVPYEGRAQVFAELDSPEGSLELPLQRVSGGRYVTKYQPQRLGDYAVRLRARGLSPRQYPFVREFSGTLAIKRQELEGVPPEARGEPSAPSAAECAQLLKRCLSEQLRKLGEHLKDKC